MTTKTFVWVDTNVGYARTRELQKSKALSHAAYTSWRSRRTGRSPVGASAVWQPVEEDKDEPPDDPGPVIWKGHSDPFRTTPVAVTATVNQAFHFLRDVMIPSTNWGDAKTGSWMRSFLPSLVVDRFIYSMSDEWSALAETLPMNVAIARLTGSLDMDRQNTRSRMRVIQRLQSSLAGPSDKATRDLAITLTKTLFIAASLGNNLSEAKLHGKALRKLLYQKSQIEGMNAISTSILWATIFYDVQIAQTTMDSSIFDVEDWASSRLRKEAKPVFDYFEPLHAGFAQSLDSSLDRCPLLKETCLDIHEVVWLLEQTHPLSSEMNGIMMNVYANAKHNIGQLRLSNHLVRIRDSIDKDELRPFPMLCPHMEAALTVGLMAYLATFIGNPQVGGQYVWSRISHLLIQLRNHLEHTSSKSSLAPPRMLLFANWVGATWQMNPILPAVDVPAKWFLRGFVGQARQMRLDNWSDIQSVLNSFVPSHYARPEGRCWVHNALADIGVDAGPGS